MTRRSTFRAVFAGLAIALAPVLMQPAAADEEHKTFRFPYDLTPGYDEAGNVMTGEQLVAKLTGGRDRAGKGPDLHSQNMHLKGSFFQTAATNSDISFWGKYAYVGNYNGFRVFDISGKGNPKEIANVACRGPQNDTSVWGNILILSVDAVMAGPECGAAQLPVNPVPTEGWEGIRIFDVSNPADPQFVKSVYTDCGSHTNNIIPDLANNRLLVYVLSYALRSGPTCGAPGQPGSPGHGQISIVEVPLDRPEDASVINIVPIPVNQTFDDLAFIPGINATDGCHDVQFFLELGLAAAACLSEGQTWDISDPANPVILEHFDNDDIEIWHSASFTWDGQTTIFGDETIFGSCIAPTDMHGRIWFYETAAITDETDGATPVGSFLIPRQAQEVGTDSAGNPIFEYCGSHLFNVLPRRDGMDILASSWYGGGTSVIDFTDPANAVEIAYYDAQDPIIAETWSTYWYNGFIYANDITRGFDVFNLSDFAGANTVKFDYLNPQVQETTIP